MTLHDFARGLALLSMAVSCAGIGASILIGHGTLTVLFAVLAMVFYNLSRWHDRRAEVTTSTRRNEA